MSENGNGNGSNGAAPIGGIAPYERPQCTAHAKNSGDRCKRTPEPGFTVCRYHGGLTPIGTAHPSYVHGRYSRHMPAAVKARYEQFLADPTLTHLRPEIALVAQQLEDMLERLNAGESTKLWEKCIELLDDHRDALVEQSFGYDPSPSPDALLAELGTTMRSGLTTFNIFPQIQPILEQYRRLADSENKRINDLNQKLTTEQAVLFVQALGDSINRHVSNPKERAAVIADFRIALNR